MNLSIRRNIRSVCIGHHNGLAGELNCEIYPHTKRHNTCRYSVAFQFLFVGVLYFLLAQVEGESARVFQSANIGNCSNKLIKDVFELSAIGHSELAEIIASGGYEDRISAIRSDLKELEVAAKDDPAQQLVVRQSAKAGEEAFMYIEQLRKTFESGGALAAIDQLKQLRGELRDCVKRMISSDLVAMAQTEKKRAEESHYKQLAFRKQIKVLLIAGLVLNTAITIFVALFISKQIAGRLNILVDNNFRLASKLPLNPLIGGSDEIANLDATFHEMAVALGEAKQREKSLIDHSLDVICSLDAHGKFTAANPACQRNLGYSEEDLLGVNLKSILVEEDLENFNASLSNAKAGQAETKLESRIRQKDGTVVDVLWSIHWVQSEKSFFCVGHDITARKEVERLKQQFMAMISHDLRTPLATMANYFEMLDTGLFGELNERGKRLLGIAESNSKRMLCLINDLLDLERAEFGGLTLDPSTQELHKLLDQSVKSVSSLAGRKQIRIDLQPTGLIVAADDNRIFQVVVNLLSNAIKFSSAGGTIQVKAEQRDGMAIVHVIDQGRGIPEHLKEAIFERFQQVEIADAADRGGSGLGLAICKAIVELHGGKISVENNSDIGSTFSFSLPLAEKKDLQIA